MDELLTPTDEDTPVFLFSHSARIRCMLDMFSPYDDNGSIAFGKYIDRITGRKKFNNGACLHILHDGMQSYYFTILDDGINPSNTHTYDELINSTKRMRKSNVVSGETISGGLSDRQYVRITPNVGRSFTDLLESFFNKSKSLIIIRHGEGWHNKHYAKKYNPFTSVNDRFNSPLTIEGRKQAFTAGMSLYYKFPQFCIAPQHIYASILKRTSESAVYFFNGAYNALIQSSAGFKVGDKDGQWQDELLELEPTIVSLGALATTNDLVNLKCSCPGPRNTQKLFPAVPMIINQQRMVKAYEYKSNHKSDITINIIPCNNEINNDMYDGSCDGSYNDLMPLLNNENKINDGGDGPINNLISAFKGVCEEASLPKDYPGFVMPSFMISNLLLEEPCKASNVYDYMRGEWLGSSFKVDINTDVASTGRSLNFITIDDVGKLSYRKKDKDKDKYKKKKKKKKKNNNTKDRGNNTKDRGKGRGKTRMK